MKKFLNVGFADITVTERAAFGLDDLSRYPLFAPDFLVFLRRLIPPARHGALVFSIVVKANKPVTPAHSAR